MLTLEIDEICEELGIKPDENDRVTNEADQQRIFKYCRDMVTGSRDE